MRQRLRPAYTPEELAEIYARPHDHTRWQDHLIRVAVTSAIAQYFVDEWETVADLSCGDAEIARSLGTASPVLGDLAPGYKYCGPIEQTIDEIPPVDVFICSETMEHLDDPDAVLVKIRQKAKQLVLSTPVDAWNEPNPEHYWAWSREDVEGMLKSAGWRPVLYNALDLRDMYSPYCFGIWVCT